jgi:hypothetical protein
MGTIGGRTAGIKVRKPPARRASLGAPAILHLPEAARSFYSLCFVLTACPFPRVRTSGWRSE